MRIENEAETNGLRFSIHPDGERTLLGRVVAHYRVLAKLGGGNMGVVYRAEDLQLQRTVALKFLPADLTSQPDARRRFLNEARAASALDHPNICTIHEIGESVDKQIFMAMACYEGETLKSKICRGPLGAEEVRQAGIQLARGLAKAHVAGIIHRDIKPANVFITNDGLVKILDFGVAKLVGTGTVARDGAFMGTIHYMSPEQITFEAVDYRSDIWSFGVLMYEMITGKLPFPGHYPNAVIHSILNEDPTPPRSILDSVPNYLAGIIMRCLEKDRGSRYAGVADIEKELQNSQLLPSPSTRATRSIAVLPFANMSADPDQEYFCDGMAEEIMNSLANVSGLRVVARTSAFSFKGKNCDVREIGHRLGVESLLEGGVRKVGNRLRITAQLIDTRDGHQSWSGLYDRDEADLFAIQEEIALNIVKALRVTLRPENGKHFRQPATANIQAYDFYLRGREYFYQLTRRGLDFARRMFAKAAAIDSGFALAYAGAADSCSFLCMWFERSPEMLQEADLMSLKAIELGPDLAEAHASRGLALSINQLFDEAAVEFERAIALNPRLYEAFYFYARDASAQGRMERAAELYRKAHEVRPEEFQSLFLCSQALRSLDRQEEAEEIALYGIEAAERHLDLYPEDTRAMYLGAAAMIIYGQKERGLRWAQTAATLDPERDGMLYQLACIHSLAGEADKAVEYLEDWEQEGALPRNWLENDCDLDNCRTHPRFIALMDRL
jgi:serine/threonine protein kinase/tetratricopeptide (TPR) repeat protein